MTTISRWLTGWNMSRLCLLWKTDEEETWKFFLHHLRVQDRNYWATGDLLLSISNIHSDKLELDHKIDINVYVYLNLEFCKQFILLLLLDDKIHRPKVSLNGRLWPHIRGMKILSETGLWKFTTETQTLALVKYSKSYFLFLYLIFSLFTPFFCSF